MNALFGGRYTRRGENVLVFRVDLGGWQVCCRPDYFTPWRSGSQASPIAYLAVSNFASTIGIRSLHDHQKCFPFAMGSVKLQKTTHVFRSLGWIIEGGTSNTVRKAMRSVQDLSNGPCTSSVRQSVLCF